jgi:hypothetical protein
MDQHYNDRNCNDGRRRDSDCNPPSFPPSAASADFGSGSYSSGVVSAKAPLFPK